MRTFERRVFPLSDIKIRAANDNTQKLHFTGRAVVYGQMSDDLGGWSEVILPGAATRTLAAKPDVRFLINHNADLLLGRTASGTVTLVEDEEGVLVDSNMADVTYARDLAVLLERKDISQMSFGFWITRDTWSGNLHQVGEFDLDGGDVSAVTFPAFPQTSAELRAQARRHGATGSIPGAVADTVDLAKLLRSIADVTPEAAALALGGADHRVGKVLSGDNSQLVQDAIEALTTLLAKTDTGSDAGEYSLQRAQHRLHELELLASL